MIILRNLNPKPFFRTDPILSRLSLSSRPDLTAAPFSQTSPELYCRGPGFNGASMLDYITSLVPCRVTYRISARSESESVHRSGGILSRPEEALASLQCHEAEQR